MSWWRGASGCSHLSLRCWIETVSVRRISSEHQGDFLAKVGCNCRLEPLPPLLRLVSAQRPGCERGGNSPPNPATNYCACCDKTPNSGERLQLGVDRFPKAHQHALVSNQNMPNTFVQ